MSTEAEAAPPAETPPPAPWDAGIYDPAKPGQFVPDWHSKAPAEEAEIWADYKDKTNPLEIVKHERKQRIDAQTALRNKPLSNLPPRPEGETATPEAWAAYRQSRGLPVDAKAYEVVKPDDFPAELWRENEVDRFKEFALEHELSPAQVKALSAFHTGLSKEALAAHGEWAAEQQRLQEEARQLHIRNEKEALIRNYGPKVDQVKEVVMDFVKTRNLDPESFNPNSPQWMGAQLFDALAFAVSTHPMAGDPTGRDFGKASGAGTKTADYFRNLKPGDEDWKILADASHPKSKALRAESDAAYETEAIQKKNR